jgi:hypothetical protein
MSEAISHPGVSDIGDILASSAQTPDKTERRETKRMRNGEAIFSRAGDGRRRCRLGWKQDGFGRARAAMGTRRERAGG